ncbi:unnamed protein product [Heligmosomoides polygyrus]|uniref:Methyltransferase n=1 Tax=Heligmosomoides polygyrus TaxID=6339 RepID=A0A183F621_HELPZ|nr:unnamed protein product [Heligmosomoides polygyrus]
MKMVLTFLPTVVARVGSVKRVLDFGAGPTIHVAASFRNNAAEIYLADYLPQNRRELSRWRDGKSDFDWSQPLKMILTQEGNTWNDLDEMVALTRKKVGWSVPQVIPVNSLQSKAAGRLAIITNVVHVSHLVQQDGIAGSKSRANVFTSTGGRFLRWKALITPDNDAKPARDHQQAALESTRRGGGYTG